jgi:hypothetical protein
MPLEAAATVAVIVFVEPRVRLAFLHGSGAGNESWVCLSPASFTEAVGCLRFFIHKSSHTRVSSAADVECEKNDSKKRVFFLCFFWEKYGRTTTKKTYRFIYFLSKRFTPTHPLPPLFGIDRQSIAKRKTK